MVEKKKGSFHAVFHVFRRLSGEIWIFLIQIQILQTISDQNPATRLSFLLFQCLEKLILKKGIC